MTSPDRKTRENSHLIASFKIELLTRDLKWREEPFDASSNWRLRLRVWNPGRSVHMLVEAHDVDPEPNCPDDDAIHVAVAYYDNEDKLLADAGFGITAYTAALKLIDDIVSERFVVQVFESTGIAKIGPPSDLTGVKRSRCRSWLGTFDFNR